MTLIEFLKRFVLHATLAATLWFAFALALERLIPGFISPFLNLPFFGLCLIAAVFLAISFNHTETRLGKVANIIILIIAASIGGAFIWSRVNAFGWSGVVVMACATLFAALTIYALTVESN